MEQRLTAIRAVANGQRCTAAASNANRVYRIRFAFASSQLVVPKEVGPALVSDARDAPLVVLKGRTDGTTDNAADARLARERAMAVRDHLVAAGVSLARVRVTYQAAGDGVEDNTTPLGRAANRRVDIEIYGSTPVEAPRGMS